MQLGIPLTSAINQNPNNLNTPNSNPDKTPKTPESAETVPAALPEAAAPLNAAKPRAGSVIQQLVDGVTHLTVEPPPSHCTHILLRQVDGGCPQSSTQRYNMITSHRWSRRSKTRRVRYYHTHHVNACGEGRVDGGGSGRMRGR